MKTKSEPLARRSKEIRLNLLPQENDLLRTAAHFLGFNFATDFVRSVALERARRVFANMPTEIHIRGGRR